MTSLPGVWVFEVVRRALAHSLRVPADATKREIRVDGAIASAVGFVVALVGVFLPWLLRGAGVPHVVGRALLAVVLVGWGLLVIGGYRAVTGRHPDREDYSYASSLGRIFTMVGVVVLGFAALMGLMFVVLYVLGIE